MANKFNPPWDLPDWRFEAERWIRERLTERGLSTSGPIEQIHDRPWSTVLRIPTNEGVLFFKAGGPTQSFEPRLLKLLNERRPQDVLPLIAADVERGWSLMPDGGQTLRKKMDAGAGFEAWMDILPRFAALQIASSGWQDEMLATGMPDRRLSLLPQLYLNILNDPKILLISDEVDGLSAEQHERLLALAPTVKEILAELEAFGLPSTLEHGDLHDGNVFSPASGYQIYDWGDASVSHPFFTFLIPVRFMARKLGVSEYDPHPQLIGLRDAYLKPWSDFAPFTSLLSAWELAHHLSKFVRTIGWYEVVKSIEGLERENQLSVPSWFQEFLNHPTSRFLI